MNIFLPPTNFFLLLSTTTMPKKSDESEDRIQEALKPTMIVGSLASQWSPENFALTTSDFYDAFTIAHLVRRARGPTNALINLKSRH
jgi:hypothetical protein